MIMNNAPILKLSLAGCTSAAPASVWLQHSKNNYPINYLSKNNKKY